MYMSASRFPLSAPVVMQPSLNVRRLCRGLMVVQGVVTV
jgi:hypothetical protein